MLLNSCATYRSKSLVIQNQIRQGDYNAAIEALDKNKFLLKSRNQLLYYFEKGMLAHLNKEYELSNTLFNQADAFIEANRSNRGNVILGALLNPEKETYKGEDFEKVAIHYYKALNYMFLNKYDDALVEAKRINLQLQKLNEKYPNTKKNRYKDDAFAHNLQGLLYEALGDVNNAFIAYRNSVDLYLENDGNYFGVNIPMQLKQDLLRTASFMGFKSDVERYQELLGVKFEKSNSEKTKEVVVFWENGLVPYKDQEFYTFTILPGNKAGYLTIFNKDLNLDFVIPIPTGGNNRAEFSDIDVFNVSFPKYIAQPSYYNSAKIKYNDTIYNFQPIQDFETIAFKTLRDRTLREIGKTVVRLATKKVAQYALKNQNKDLGAVLGIVNAITEGSDTRNWQTLPNKIYYSRIPIIDNKEKVTIEFIGNNTKSIEMNIDANKKIQFKKVETLEVLR